MGARSAYQVPLFARADRSFCKDLTWTGSAQPDYKGILSTFGVTFCLETEQVAR